MFLTVAVTAAIKFGSSVRPSLLETLPTTIPLHFAAFFVALQLCLSSAVSNSALYQHMEDCMEISRGKYNSSTGQITMNVLFAAFNHRRCVLRTTLTLLAVLIAESVPRFDLVMSLIGGTLTGPLVFILPPLFYLKMLSIESKHEKEVTLVNFTKSVYNGDEETSLLTNSDDNRCRKQEQELGKSIEIACCVTIVAVSAVCTVVTTYVNVNSAIAFTDFAQPCIYNVSKTLVKS
jgi:hypothetical protein